jgi:hypothetical protein
MNNIYSKTKQSSIINIRDNAGAIKNGLSRETDNIGHTRRRQTKQRQNTICV